MLMVVLFMSTGVDAGQHQLSRSSTHLHEAEQQGILCVLGAACCQDVVSRVGQVWLVSLVRKQVVEP